MAENSLILSHNGGVWRGLHRMSGVQSYVKDNALLLVSKANARVDMHYWDTPNPHPLYALNNRQIIKYTKGGFVIVAQSVGILGRANEDHAQSMHNAFKAL